ncbi:hypothetical protein M378DRAFT_582430 [Amanita muscaria Koide BX008]|uniref:Uncharacterized protein n=1 Tax=Amanita muscaria (strain Koide BX008) TaxID=946122 RepID=A0A0C2X7B9_AMAMK|nr:hypothetical protein M378DRAFT_582430 [Amanita muscaria Koide BX008]
MDSSETALSVPSTLRGATVRTAEGNDFSNTGRDTIKITVQNINIDRRPVTPDSEQAVEDNEDPQPVFGSWFQYHICPMVLALTPSFQT